MERVDIRLARQGALHRDSDPLKVTSLVTEHVLRSVVGGPEVMIEQVDHLLAMAERPNVEVRVLPADGRDACALGGFELLTRPGDVDPFIAVTFDPGRPHYHESTHDIDVFVATFRYLADVALPPDESTRRIQDIRENHTR
jgi:hypothetical protein